MNLELPSENINDTNSLADIRNKVKVQSAWRNVSTELFLLLFKIDSTKQKYSKQQWNELKKNIWFLIVFITCPLCNIRRDVHKITKVASHHADKIVLIHPLLAPF